MSERRSRQGRSRRAAALRARVASPEENYFDICTIPFCRRPTQRAAKSGLSATLCAAHVRYRQRHGSPWCPSPSAYSLRPYIKAAESWIGSHRTTPAIQVALESLHGLLATAGRAIIVTRLRGLPPGRRAKVALARLRDAGVKPERILARVLAVHALINEAPQACHRIRAWRLTAAAKSVHRLASGTHQRWTDESGKVLTETHTFPRSAGLVMLHLGAMIEDECEGAIERHLVAVIDLKVTRYGPHPAVSDPLKFVAEADHRARRGKFRRFGP